jgi:hypothetical protein
MFNQTLEDIKVLLEQILEELKFNNLSQKQKEEEWGCIEMEQQEELENIRNKTKPKQEK